MPFSASFCFACQTHAAQMHLKCENPPSPTSDLGCPLGQVQELPYNNPKIKVFLVWSIITLTVSTMKPSWMA